MTHQSREGGRHRINPYAEPLKDRNECLNANDSGKGASYPSDTAILTKNQWTQLAAYKPCTESETKLKHASYLFGRSVPDNGKSDNEKADEDKN
jgi:hypothetical protein